MSGVDGIDGADAAVVAVALGGTGFQVTAAVSHAASERPSDGWVAPGGGSRLGVVPAAATAPRAWRSPSRARRWSPR